MTGDELSERAVRAFERHDAFERREADGGFAATTTRFDALVTAEETEGWALRYTVTVRAPMLSTAVVDGPVGSAVEEGWFETYGLRLEDAPMATRADVELDDLTVEEDDGDAVARFVFEFGTPDRAPEVAKDIVEYVEGTYLEGVVPGYEYDDPVAGLLNRARGSGDDAGDTGERGPMPL